jgi:predicted ATPase/class 3 adenylate cyclase
MVSSQVQAETRSDLPTGTVTFLVTDIEGSTTLLQALLGEYPAVLEQHNRVLRAAVAGEGGLVVSTAGDSVFAVFRSAQAAVRAAVTAQRVLAEQPWPPGHPVRVRMGVHTGEGVLGGDDYVGLDVHRAARIGAAAHGGQVLASATTAALCASPAAPGDPRFVDLGEHRLKDLVHPERLFQIAAGGLATAFPPVRSAGGILTILPMPRTSFVPRPEVDEVAALLPATRLLTLTGPGGTGKTRLALELALRLKPQMPDGVVFVDLAPVAHPDLVASAIAGTLQVQPGPGAPLERLVEHLRSARMLLVLDNFEQVLAAADVVSRLLDECPSVHVLVTSRAALRLSGEQEVPVPPLGRPADDAPAEVLASAAGQLFVQRASAVRPGFRLDARTAAAVASIVDSLDGLPLAVELAAARVRLLPPEAMAARLAQRDFAVLGAGSRDVPDRQRSLEAVIGWSYDLLEPEAREAFRRFSVFVESVGLDQLGAVLCPDAAEHLLDLLDSLTEQSLLRQVDAGADVRFRMLATIREYAMRRLADDPEELRRTRDAHARTFLALVEQAAPFLTGWDQRRWLDRLDQDADNIRAALDWCLAARDGETAARFVAGLWRFWQIGGHLDEGAARAAAALDLTCPDPRLRAAALEAAGGVAWWRGDMTTAKEAYREALALVEPLGDVAATANARYNLALTVGYFDDPVTGNAMLEQALSEARAAGDRRVEAWVIWGQADLAQLSSDWRGLRDLGDEALAKFRQLDDPFGIGWSLFMSGNGNLRLGGASVAAAGERLREAARLFARFHDNTALMLLCWAMAHAARREQPERALRLTGAARRLKQRTGAALLDVQPPPQDEAPIELAFLDDLGSERVDQLIEEGMAFSPDEALACLLDEMP